MGKQSHQFRIIGGQYRSRRLPIANLPGLRPTGDRVRETLFNWLQITIQGASCLDLFAGSGALGFEAASRGASKVVMIERAGVAVRQLQSSVKQLESDNVQVVQADALEWLKKKSRQTFDVVFLDPPFEQELLDGCCTLLQQGGWLRPKALVYMEYAADGAIPTVACGLRILNQKTIGQVGFALLEYE